MRNAIRPSFLFLKEVFDGTEQYEMHRKHWCKTVRRLMRYSMQLIMLQKLLRYKLLSEESISLLKKG